MTFTPQEESYKSAAKAMAAGHLSDYFKTHSSNSSDSDKIDLDNITSALMTGDPIASGRILKVTGDLPVTDDAKNKKKKDAENLLGLMIQLDQINRNLEELYKEQELLLKQHDQEKQINLKLHQNLASIEEEISALKQELSEDEYEASPLAQDKEKEAIQIRKDLEASNKRLADIEQKIAENSRKIEEQLHQKRNLLNQQLDTNEDFVQNLEQLRGQTTPKTDLYLESLLHAKPGLEVEFEPDDTVDQKIQKTKNAIESQNLDIQREQVEVEEEMASNENTIRSLNISDIYKSLETKTDETKEQSSLKQKFDQTASGINKAIDTTKEQSKDLIINEPGFKL